MAPSAKSLSFLFLLLLISSLQIHARESQFFSKVTRVNSSSTTTNNNNNDNAATKEKETHELIPESTEEPSHTKEEEPSFTPQNQNGFGLYGHGSEQFSSNSVNDAYYTPTNFPQKAHTQQYQQKSFSTGYPTNNYNGYDTNQQAKTQTDTSYVDTAYLNNYNGYETKQQGKSDTKYADTAYLNNNYNGYETKQQGMSDTRYVDTSYNNNNNYNGYETKQQGKSDTKYVDTAYLNNNYNGYETKQQGKSDMAYLNSNYNGKEMKQQGMSDTRFLENGKYYYGNNNNNNQNLYQDQYETHKQNQNGYGSYRGGVESSKAGRGAPVEFSNSMDRFQNQYDQEFQETQQEEYVP
ncbi:protein E6-like [Macadamia integrifolia]|uniref:protein E6-like n=1 Tax=Macadamia integrifolia TaxID=60698 RepID=UPI001C527AA1|nr:protein E6-like [Macadamia integrifolia]